VNCQDPGVKAHNLHDILDQVNPTQAEDAGQQRVQSRGLIPEEMFHQSGRCIA
jgi:hypothetical protein